MDTKPHDPATTPSITDIKKELADKAEKPELLESFEQFLARKAVQTS